MLSKVTRSSAWRSRNSCVLDRDHRLIGESRDQLDLLFGEWLYDQMCEHEDADRFVATQQRNAEHRAISAA